MHVRMIVTYPIIHMHIFLSILQCIILFYKEEQCQQIMRQLLFEVTLYHFHLFEHTADAEFSKIADVVESFYTFNSQIAKKLPQAYSDENSDCKKLIRFGKNACIGILEAFTNGIFCVSFSRFFFYLLTAMKAMTMPEVGPIKNAIAFIVHFTIQSRNYPNMTTAMLEMGEEVVHTTLLCIGGYTLRNHVDLFADIFVAFNKKYPAELVVWLKLLEVPDFPTSFVSAAEKDIFMKAILRFVCVNMWGDFIHCNFVFFFHFPTEKKLINVWYRLLYENSA